MPVEGSGSPKRTPRTAVPEYDDNVEETPTRTPREAVQQYEDDVEDARDDNAEEETGYISRADLERILAERDRKHSAEMNAVRATMPQAMVAAHAGGPGNDNHQVAWNLTEQEAAKRGEVLDHWDVPDNAA